ncbi:MAG: site-specific integrase [Ferrovum myxofaciens]|uniref:tyrosine-type recombinase/integrase n=1 Tax=Ferrovum myxofaciens TaxID=416213 RepID=UPI003EBA15FB
MNSPSDLPVSRVAAAATEGTRLRDETLLLFPLESLQYLDRDSAVRCQAMLGHGDRFGVWETPPALVGRRISPNIATLSLRERLVRYLPDTPPPLDSFDALIDEGVLWMTRYALLCRMGPAATHKNKGSSLDATSLASNLLQYVSRIVATGIARQLQGAPSEQTGFVGCLTVDDLIELKQVRSIGYDLKRMTMFADRGLWNDAPIKSKLQKNTDPKGRAVPPSEENKSTPHPPIPDDYLAEMGPRVLWVVQDLGPNLLHLLEAIPELFSSINITKSKNKTALLCRYFNQNVWRDRDGQSITAPPHYLKTASGLRRVDWPPTNWDQVKVLSAILQGAHLWVTLLAMAGRISEIRSLPLNCVEWARDGNAYVNGKTYKLSQYLAGEERDWPAPEALIDALAQQIRLVKAWELIMLTEQGKIEGSKTPQTEGGHFWASLGSASSADSTYELSNERQALMRLAQRLGMDPRPGGKSLHPHRFRKTIARLMGIAIVDSPRVLMRLLGHRDIAMTMHYILTDKALRAEIEQVTRELRIMRCQGVLEDIRTAQHTPGAPVFGGHGGGAAPLLSDAITSKENELHQQGLEWEVDTTYELALHLTLGGKFFRLTRPGVVCLKEDRNAGPCTCDSSCINRIEEKTARRDVNDLIPILVNQGHQALANNELLLLANTVEQLEDELARFEDIAAEWSKKPEVVTLREAVA